MIVMRVILQLGTKDSSYVSVYGCDYINNADMVRAINILERGERLVPMERGLS